MCVCFEASPVQIEQKPRRPYVDTYPNTGPCNQPAIFDQLLDVNQRISFESLPHLRHRVRAVDHPKGPHSRGFSPSPEGGGKRQVPGARLAEGVQPDLSQDTNPDSDGLASFLTLFGAG